MPSKKKKSVGENSALEAAERAFSRRSSAEAKAQGADPQGHFIPTTIERDARGFERHKDVISSNYNERTIFVTGGIDDAMGQLIVAQLLDLNRKSPTKPIRMIINSPGGSIMAGNAIVDTMRHITAPVHTVGMGMCASMGSYILSMGEPGHRSVLPDTEVMVHQPLTGSSMRQQTDIQITADHIKQLRRQLEERYMLRMGVSRDQFKKLVHAMTERDNYLPALIAVKLGLVDRVINPADTAEAKKHLTPEQRAWKEKEFSVIMAHHEAILAKIRKVNPDDEEEEMLFKRAVADIIDAREAAMKNKTVLPEFIRTAANDAGTAPVAADKGKKKALRAPPPAAAPQ